MFKKILIGLVSLVLLLVVAVGALLFFVDVNRFKPEIVAYVQDNYQRKLTLDGDLKLSVFPRIAVALPAVKLSEPKKDSVSISLQGASIGVNVLPLIKGQVVADTVILAGLNAKIVRFEDGTTSIDDLIAPPGKGDEPVDQTAAASNDEPASISINIGGIEVTDANLTIDDRVAKSVYKLSGLNLITGPIRDGLLTPVKLSASLASTAPKANASISLDSKIAMDMAKQLVRIESAELKIKGDMDGTVLDQDLILADLSADASRVQAKSIVSKTRINQGARKILATLKFPLLFDFVSEQAELASIDGQLEVSDPAIGDKPVQLPFNAKVSSNTKKQWFDLSLNVDAPDTALQAKLNVKGFDKPKIKFDLKADRIDVDRYLPPAAKDEAAKGSESNKTPDASAKKPAADVDTPVDLSALNGLDVQGQISIGKLLASGLTVSNIKAGIKVAGGVALLKPLAADLYQGNLNGQVSASAKGNAIAVGVAMSKVAIGPLLQDLMDDRLLEGRGDVRIDVKSAGKSVNVIKSALQGKANLALANGAIMGINLAEKIRDAKKLLGKGKADGEASDAGKKTDFTALTASFKIRNGVATNDDLDGRSPLIRIGGGGKIDIAQGSLDYTAKVSIVGTSKGQGGQDLSQLRSLTLPVRLTGAFDALNWEIDWKLAAKELAKSKLADKLGDKLGVDVKDLKGKKEAARQAAKTKVDDKKQELKDKVSEKLGGKLKSLFK